MCRPVSIVALLALLLTAGAAPSPSGIRLAPPDKPSSIDERDVADVLNRASAVALAEVISIVEENHMPADGPLEHAVKLRLFESSGAPPDRIEIILAWTPQVEQFPPATKPQPPARVPLSPNPLIVGQRYWFAWCSPHEHDKYPNGIIAWWPENAAPAKALEDSIRTNRYQWTPRYEPATGCRYGWRTDEKNNSTTVRQWKGDQLLWEKTLPDISYQFWIIPRAQLDLTFPVDPTRSNLFLELRKASGRTLLDFDTGRTLTAGHFATEEQFSLTTGKRVGIVNTELFPTGGREVGGAADAWIRITVTTCDENGNPKSVQSFRQDDDKRIPLAPATRP
jgi:hypothetical protein